MLKLLNSEGVIRGDIMTTVKFNQTVDLDDPNYYNNRELSWLAFNERVLEEALDHRNPLLERFKIFSYF